MVFAQSIEKVLRFKIWLLPILSGILLILSYPPFNLPTLSFFSLVPLLFFLNSKNTSLKKSFLAGLITGFIFFAGNVMLWAFDTFPLGWLGIENNFLGFFLLLLLWLLVNIFLATFVGLFSLSYFFLKRQNFWDFLLIPSLWVIFEYLRTWSLGIFFLGRESLLGPHWTLGNLAYSLAKNPAMLNFSAIGGIYLVSFLAVLTNALLFSFLEKPNQKLIIFFFLLIFLSYFWPLDHHSMKGKTFQIALLQTKFPPSLEQTPAISWANFQVQQELMAEAFKINPDFDVLVLPENVPFVFPSPVKTKDFLIIDSERSIARFYHLKKGTLDQYQKILLVPIGDYLPYFIRWPGGLINRQWLEKIESKRTRQKGQQIKVLSDQEFFQAGVLFCSEVFSPGLHRQFVQKGAQILFNLGSLGFARGSKFLDDQIQAMLQFRAAENSRYLARTTNFGRSYIIGPKGEIVAQTATLDSQILLAEVELFSQKTFYTRFGDWILILAGFLILTMLKLKK